MVNVAKSNNKKQSLRKKKLKSLDSSKQFKREERAGHFKPSKSSTSTCTITRTSEPLMHSVTINVGIMKNVNLNLKPVRGKTLPLKVKPTINYDDLKKKSNRKGFTSRPVFLWLKRIFFTLSRSKRSTCFRLESLALDLNLTPTRKS